MKRYCPKCKEYLGETKFCPQCGTETIISTKNLIVTEYDDAEDIIMKNKKTDILYS